MEQRVQEGKLTQEQADRVLAAIKDNQALCDGTGKAGAGVVRAYGAGFGQGRGSGDGFGNKMGRGQGGTCYGRSAAALK